MDTDVDPATQALIARFKDALAVATNDFMGSLQRDSFQTSTAQAKFAALLRANKAPNHRALRYGANLTVSIGILAGSPPNAVDPVFVDIGFSISCGEDHMLLVYERRRGSWQEVIRWQSGKYNEISGAFGDFFEYVLVPGGTSGDWALAVAHGRPWCTSRWSSFALDLVAPGSSGVSQRRLLHREEEYVRDSEVTMHTEPQGFEMRMNTGDLDVDIMTRSTVRRYRVTGDSVRRVQPIALNGRDFVDEWLQSDWTDAARWSDSKESEQLRQNHDAIFNQRNDTEHIVSYTYGPVSACSDNPKHFQVELDRNPGANLFYQILENGNGYTMSAVSEISDARCTGRDLMER
jgi:hypothetical protein